MASRKNRVIEDRKRTLKASLIAFYIKYAFQRTASKRYKIPQRTNKANRVPRKLSHDLHVESFTLDDYQLHVLEPLSGQQNNRHIVYLHGGAYVNQITPVHWRFLADLVKESGSRLSVVQYPLAPESHHVHAVEHVVKVTKKIRDKYADDELCLAGDSAGAGLAMALVQELIARNLPQPYTKLALISPWLDPTSLDLLSDDEIAKEVILTVPGLKYAAEKYAGPDSIAHPHVSPLKGGFDGFPEVAVWMGGCDFFYRDLELFLQKLEATRVDYHAYIAEHMYHDYPILPMPEGAWATRQISHFVRGYE